MLEQVGVEEQVQQERYVVHLPVFEGPLDLLLHLIEKRQMEITTISLMAVTDQYLAYLQQWQTETLPLASMASFISIAARLLFIKSQSLLPQAAKAEEAEQGDNVITMAEELQRHLVEYKLAKDIALVLRQREEAGLQTHGRSGLLAGIEAQLAWTPPTLMGLEATALSRAFQRLLQVQVRNEENGNALIPTARVRVSDCMAEIAGRLKSVSEIYLAEVLENEYSRIVIVVTFIAVLEMWKWQRINVRQDALMGPIIIERGERWSETSQDDIEE